MAWIGWQRGAARGRTGWQRGAAWAIALAAFSGCASSGPVPTGDPGAAASPTVAADLHASVQRGAARLGPRLVEASTFLRDGLLAAGGHGLAAGAWLGAQLVEWTPRVARASLEATRNAAVEVRSWGPPLAQAARFSALQIAKLEPEFERIHDVPEGQDFAIGGRRGFLARRRIESFREQRFQYVVPQRLDYSCGAAALATLFQFYYEDPVAEAEIVQAMLEGGDVDRIRREGFSLLDMKRFAEGRGYQTQGFRIETEVLDRLAIPAIGLVNTGGYGHFVVIKGARDGDVYLADPALGQRKVSLEAFADEWNGVIFFVARQRLKDVVAPLEMLALNRPAPVEALRDLSRLGVRNLTFSPREF